MLPIEKDKISIVSERLIKNEREAIEILNKYKKNKDDKTYQKLINITQKNKKEIKKYIPLLQDIFRHSNRKINAIFETKLYGTICNSYLIYPSTFFSKIAENENLKTNDWWHIEYKNIKI